MTKPDAASRLTPPHANVSAEETAHSAGSSTTRSAPPSTAMRARVHLSAAAAAPLCTQQPLMQQTTAHSGPSSRRVCAIWYAWPE